MKNVNIYVVLLAFLILNGSFSWIARSWLTGTSLGIVGILTVLSFVICYKRRQTHIPIGLMTFLIMALSALFAYKTNIAPGLSRIASLFPVITLFMLKRNDLLRVSKTINRIFTILVALSFILHLFRLIGLNLPNLGYVVYNQYDFDNYFYIYLNSFVYGVSFTGFTLEPGFFSLLLVCLLLLNQFDFKKKCNWIYFVCLIFTMSLGGYLLCFVGYNLQKSLEGGNVKTLFKVTLGTITIVGLVLICALTYNGGNNILVEEIVSRLMFDEELGIVGNNRESVVAKEIIDRFFYSNDVWMGIGYDRYEDAVRNIKWYDACSWRVFVIIHGAIYTCVYFILSVMFLMKTNIKRTLPFFVIYWLDFIQHGELFSETMYFLLLCMNLNLKEYSKYKYSALSNTRKLCMQNVI
jgi:hypothetical protein